jgi:hypothetical protein
MIALVLVLTQAAYRPLSVEELAAASPFSGVAVVERAGTRLDPTTGAVYTDAHLRVRETWGAPFPAEVILTQLGGELDGVRSAAVGWNYALAPGRTIAFFCKPWKGPYFAVTGLRQGLFHVEGNAASWEMDRDGRSFTLTELRARVGRTLGRELVPAPPTRDGAGSARRDEGSKEDVPARHETPPAPPPGRFFFALAALLGLAAVLVRWARRR